MGSAFQYCQVCTINDFKLRTGSGTPRKSGPICSYVAVRNPNQLSILRQLTRRFVVSKISKNRRSIPNMISATAIATTSTRQSAETYRFGGGGRHQSGYSQNPAWPSAYTRIPSTTREVLPPRNSAPTASAFSPSGVTSPAPFETKRRTISSGGQ